jgi:hypothetical protein
LIILFILYRNIIRSIRERMPVTKPTSGFRFR